MNGVPFLVFSVFAIAAVGYALGRITVKGAAMGTVGVFIIAVVFGALFYGTLEGELSDHAGDALRILATVGIALFVTAFGLASGQTFFRNMGRNFKPYVVTGVVMVLSTAVTAVACILIGRAAGGAETEELTAVVTGLMSGALTSAPALSVAGEAAAESENLVSAGYALSCLFGVLLPVLFIWIAPKIGKRNMQEERTKLREELLEVQNRTKPPKAQKLVKLTDIDKHGLFPFAVCAVLGIFLGSIRIGRFTLTATVGCLIVSLLIGHFGRIGAVTMKPKQETLSLFQEFGLMLFLAAAGISGGSCLVSSFRPEYILMGAVLTVVPLAVGSIITRLVFKTGLLNSLGSIAGGMTSSQAAGAAVNVSKTEDVAMPYAAVYPIAAVSAVIASIIIIHVF